MKKQFLIVVGIWLTAALSLAQIPHVITIDDVNFHNGKITNYHSPYTKIIIPSYLNGQVVTSIGDDAFNNKSLSSAVLPTSIVSIGKNAFKSNELTNIEISSSTTLIDDYAFSSNALTSVMIPVSWRVSFL